MDTKSGCIFCFRSKILYFCFGIIFGLCSGILWQELFSPIRITPEMDRTEEVALFKNESREKLLKYIEGKWRSSIGDLVVNIEDTDINGSFIVLESTILQPSRKEKFKVLSIDKVDGLFGLVILSVCGEKSKCEQHEVIKVQLNKVFGIEKTITMSYDRRLSYCVNEGICTRAFKEID